jgi:hypothetical protein
MMNRDGMKVKERRVGRIKGRRASDGGKLRKGYGEGWEIREGKKGATERNRESMGREGVCLSVHPGQKTLRP